MNLHAILPQPDTHAPAVNTPGYLVPVKKAAAEPSGFVAALAHEIRNPLSNIKLATEVLRSMITDVNQRSYLDIILRGSDKINTIVTDLLHSSWEQEIPPCTYSVNQLLDEILNDTGDRLLLKKVKVSKNYSVADDKIVLNRPKIKIALTNIVINAIEAMPEGSGQLNLITRSEGGKYYIQIGDNGCGISNANLKNIFRPYFSDKKGGLGIGLAATYNILKSENVEIKVESEKGKGTCFIFLFSNRSLLKAAS